MAISQKIHGIGTFWHGQKLGVMEQNCLRSMMRQGHEVTLYSHEQVHGVPNGVRICDARQVTGDLLDSFFDYAGKGQRIAMFSDIFRYRMLLQTDLIYADTDVYLLKPLIPMDENLFAWEDPDFVCGAILSLPKTSPVLRELVNFSDIPSPIPPFFSWSKKLKLLARRLVGSRPHVSRLSPGCLGPHALTYFLRKHKMFDTVLQANSLYPIHYNEMHKFLLDYDTVIQECKDAMAIHLWSSRLKRFAEKLETIPDNSFLSVLLNEK